jgi:hypothetical protein
MALLMPAHYYQAGQNCWLDATFCNPGPDLDSMPVFVLLDVYGQYWFAPSWISLDEGIDYYTRDIPTGDDRMNVIFDFPWPDSAGSAQGIFFLGAVLDQSLSTLMSNVAEWEFGFG